MGLGARRLSIIDIEGGHQPISSEDGTTTVVQNGEIYNHEALHARLAGAGHVFATRCDTEVLVHGYEEHGPAFVRELRGMFAFALWDAPTSQARARARPLSASSRSTTASAATRCSLRVGAEVARPGARVQAASLTSRRSRRSSRSTRSLRPSRSIEGVRKLPPGHVLTWSGEDGLELTEYAPELPGRVAELRDEGEDELARELRERLRDSVRAHLIADVPVGVLLSGGIDSSVLTALAAEESAERVQHLLDRVRGARVRRARQARASSRDHYGTDHHELVVRPDAVALLTDLAQTFDEPLADSSALPTYLVSKLASDNVKVALSGEGGGRALRRLLHVCRRPARTAARAASTCHAAARRAAPEHLGQGEPRLQGQALRQRRVAAAARAPPRLEGDLRRRRPGRADGAAERDARRSHSTSTGSATRAPRAPGPSPGSRMSIARSTSSTTCS